MISPLMALARQHMAKNELVCHRVFKVIYTLAKVRGYKTIGTPPGKLPSFSFFSCGFRSAELICTCAPVGLWSVLLPISNAKCGDVLAHCSMCVFFVSVDSQFFSTLGC
jgi:hypothetical protein